MKIIEKRDFIHNNLHRADEKLIDEFYEKLKEEAVLSAKLENRALQSELDIEAGRLFSREEVAARIKK